MELKVCLRMSSGFFVSMSVFAGLCQLDRCMQEIQQHEVDMFLGRRCDATFRAFFDWGRYAQRTGRHVEAETPHALEFCAKL